MSETFKTTPGHNPIDALRYEAGVILTERDFARITAALQGITAITTGPTNISGVIFICRRSVLFALTAVHGLNLDN